MIGTCAEILTHAVFKLFGLSHINDFSAFIVHYINAGEKGQRQGLFA